jgi:hypothetical protein
MYNKIFFRKFEVLYHTSWVSTKMSRYLRCLQAFRRPLPPVEEPQDQTPPINYYAAGCAFCDEKHILGGLQPHKKRKPGISGIGGMKAQGDASYLDTAFRETLEEIYHVNSIPLSLLHTLKREMKPKNVVNSHGYVTLTFSFEDLEKFLKLAKKGGIRTTVYPKPPTTLTDLLRDRKLNTGAEIEILCLLPNLYGQRCKGSLFRKEFIYDMKQGLHL